MKTSTKLIISILTFLALIASALAQTPREQLQQKVEVTTPASSAVNIPAKPKAPLSEEQLRRIRKNLEERNQQITLDATATYLLGLTKNGEILTVQSRALRDRKGIAHAFYLLNGNTGYLVNQSTDEGRVVVTCRLDKDLNLLAAVKSDPSGTYVFPLPEAAKILHVELATWADIAEKVLGPQVDSGR